MSYPLPAHRRKDSQKSRMWVFDFDGTITAAPQQLSRIAAALRALGDRIVVLTGNKDAREKLLARIAALGFPADDVLQYHDDGTDGVARAEFLRAFGAWGAFDNRIDRAPVFAPVCPHLYVIAAVAAEDDPDAKAAAASAAKQLLSKAAAASAAKQLLS